MAAYAPKDLNQAGHVVDVARTSRDAHFMPASEAYYLEIVDRMLPSLDGLTLVRVGRGAGLTALILFLMRWAA